MNSPVHRGAGVRRPRPPKLADLPVDRTDQESHTHPLLGLQRTAGNAAVGRFLGVQRAAAGAGGTGLLARGSSGEPVRALQIDLNALGATPQLEPDGKFGGGTDAAVRFFQRAHRLKPDGIVGPATAPMVRAERAVKGANFLVPCHTPDKPGPDGAEERALAENAGGGGGGNLIAAPPIPGAAKVNLTVVLTTEAQDKDEAAAVGGKVVQVGSIADLKAVLDQHPNIGMLAVISHGGSDGSVKIGGSNEKLATIAAALTKRAPGSIDRVQFLGCNIGRDPAGMSALKGQVAAAAVEGVNCFLETQRLTPARRQNGQGKPILAPGDLPKGMTKAEFGAALKSLIPIHLDVNNHKITNPDCILGFGPGTKLATVDAEKLADLYFARSGNLVFRSTLGGTCWDDLKFDQPDKDGCRRVQV